MEFLGSERMPRYDGNRFEPPAPVARVNLRNPSGGQVVEVLMLLDSGADVTPLPRRAVESLGVPVDNGRRYWLIGFDGTATLSSVVRLELVFLGRAYRDSSCSLMRSGASWVATS